MSEIHRAFCTPDIKAVDVKRREITHLISTSSIDRAGDIVEPSGADVANFMKNPVVLANHDYSIENIIGRATSIKIQSDGLTATTQFHDKGLGADAFELVNTGFARAWSIGFRPTEHESMKDDKGSFKGFRFTKWELLEYSLVAIPANPDAVSNAVQRGIVTQSNVKYFFVGLNSNVPSGDTSPAREATAAPEHSDERLSAMRDLVKRAHYTRRGQQFKARQRTVQ